jgi:hypothetical protein
MSPTIEERQRIRIDVRVKGIEFNDELRKAVECSIALAVDRHVFRVDSISVYLGDLNGPRGGVDNFARSLPISIEATLW